MSWLLGYVWKSSKTPGPNHTLHKPTSNTGRDKILMANLKKKVNLSANWKSFASRKITLKTRASPPCAQNKPTVF